MEMFTVYSDFAGLCNKAGQIIIFLIIYTVLLKSSLDILLLKECKLEQVAVCAFLRDLLGIYLFSCHADTFYSVGPVFTPTVPRAALEADFHYSRECSHRKLPNVTVLAPPCGYY